MLKLLLIASALLPLLASADQATWLTIEPDNFNLLYKSGMQAKFYLRENAAPTGPGFHLEVTAQQLGADPAPVAVSFTGMTGSYLTEPLAAGESSVRILATLVGPADSVVVQDETFELEVVP